MDRRKVSDEEKRNSVDRGILYTSGLIAGEGLMGIILAIIAVVEVADKIDLSKYFSFGQIGSLVIFVLLLASLYWVCVKDGKKNK